MLDFQKPIMKIREYYATIAQNYDQNRFGNSYGQFVHARESAILRRFLPKNLGKTLDLGCGTGRLTHFATDGIDQSAEMVAIAQAKNPTKNIQVGDALATDFSENQFDAVFCFHLAMHLPKAEVGQLFDEVRRILKPGGVFVVDFPSRKRRKLLGWQGSTKPGSPWHGATAFDVENLLELIGSGWKITGSEGLLMWPIQRFPVTVRPFFEKLDEISGRIWGKSWASYQVLKLEKN